MSDLESRIAAIERRNQAVEQDKAWETSWVRRLTIAALTYGVVVGYLMAVGNDRPLINALVPPAGFVMSTLVLKSVRRIWQK